MEPDMPGILERCRKPGGPYLPFRQGGLTGLVLRDWQEHGGDIEELLSKLDGQETQIFKARKKIRAAMVGELFVKRYNYRGFGNAFRRMFKTPRPCRVLAGAIRLREYEIPTPEVIAALRSSRWGLPYCDYLVTRGISPLRIFCDKLAGEFSGGDPYRQFVSGIVALLVKMHGAGVEHGDLSLRNIFCRKSPIGVYSDWGVIDLDGCKVWSEELPESRRRRELARVVSSYLRCVRAFDKSLTLDVNTITFDFTRKYQELSGWNLAGSSLDTRIAYLAGRQRKDAKR